MSVEVLAKYHSAFEQNLIFIKKNRIYGINKNKMILNAIYVMIALLFMKLI